jgi:threonine/homoserine/homoserine lactone efflux protein
MLVPPEVKVFSFFYIIIFIIWIGGALFTAIAPYTFWKITQSWKAVRESPKAYFVMQRIMGILFAAVGISFWVFVWTRH